MATDRAEDERLLDGVERALERMPDPPFAGQSKKASTLETEFLTECARRRRALEAFRRLRERAAA